MRLPQQTHFRCKLFSYSRGSIAASILDYQDFRFVRLFPEESSNLGEGTWKALFFVVRGDDQREEGQGQLKDDVSQHDEGDGEHQN